MGEKGLVEEDWNERHNWRKKITQLIMGAGRCEHIVHVNTLYM
jgi:hypothetical protein